MAFSLQTSIYMDYLGVEDQIVQMFYQQVPSHVSLTQGPGNPLRPVSSKHTPLPLLMHTPRPQVDGTKVDKVFEAGPPPKPESLGCCALLLACLRCKCFPCPGCFSCCAKSTEGRDSKYDMQARTAKALHEVLFTEAKL